MKKTILISAVLVAGLISAFAMSGTARGEVFHGGDIMYSVPVKAVLFSHAVHVEDLGMGCEMCHPAVFDMVARLAEQSADFTMAGLAEGKYCGACHNGAFAFSSETQCARCHVGVKGWDAAHADEGVVEPAAH